MVGLRVRDVDVADPAGRLAHGCGDAGAAARAGPAGPVDGDAGAEPRLPREADAQEVVGEVVRRARVVGAVDGRDLLRRQRDARVELLDRRVVPGRDLAREDLRQRRAVHVQQVLRAVEVVDHRGGREGPRDLRAALAGGELVARERRVAGAEVDRAARDRVDAAARADRAVLDLVAVGRANGRNPLRDEWGDEAAAGPGERGAAVRGRCGAGGAGCEGRCDCRGDDGEDAHRVLSLCRNIST